jgi:hypothetical protein
MYAYTHMSGKEILLELRLFRRLVRKEVFLPLREKLHALDVHASARACVRMCVCKRVHVTPTSMRYVSKHPQVSSQPVCGQHSATLRVCLSLCVHAHTHIFYYMT